MGKNRLMKILQNILKKAMKNMKNQVGNLEINSK